MSLSRTCSCFYHGSQVSTVFQISKRISSSRGPQAVLIEKILEEPAIVVQKQEDVDIIGPPDSLSNLRPIVRKIPKNETFVQKQFREAADATQKWNQEFWAKHNTNFIKEKEAYIKRFTSAERPQLNADEMSEFYKDFLNKHWKTHVRYNFAWYRKNLALLLLALKVNIENLQNRIV
ncbi:COA8 family protein Y39B6A.34, mitochondrial [Euwallacea fornicatus]|uniref:COA8 family protein Y39B6A.34, mitochondrial n=1 Tax=Euwallacea fornicatus TaxID=995702 RepID=UPI00338E91D7